MNYYALRTNDQSTVSTILDAIFGDIIVFNNLSWYLNKINTKDICFVKISGDEALKRTSYDNSLVAIAEVVKKPYAIHIPYGKKTNHGTIDVKILDTFPSVTADRLYNYPSLKNTLSIGGSTKGMPNQAIGRLKKEQGEDIIKALINETILNTTHLGKYGISNRNIEILKSTIIKV